MSDKTPTTKTRGGKPNKASGSPDRLPKMLSYLRSFQVSDGILYGCTDIHGADPTPILPTWRRARGANAPDGAILTPQDTFETAKKKDEQNRAFAPNIIYWYHYACLPPDKSVLEMRWHLSVCAGSLSPAMSEESQESLIAGPDGRRLSAPKALEALIRDLPAADRLDLAARYLWRIADGSVLWRNRAYGPSRTVLHPDGIGSSFVFDVAEPVRDRFPGIGALAQWCEQGEDGVKQLIEILANALFKSESAVSIGVSTKIALSGAHEIWPSQLIEHIPHPSDPSGQKSRAYHIVDVSFHGASARSAALTYQKIANRIRRIDEWHDNPDRGAICVEHYGYEMSEGVVIRQDGRDIYSILRRYLDGQSLAREERLYLVAMLIRGGAFSRTKGGEEQGKSDPSTATPDSQE